MVAFAMVCDEADRIEVRNLDSIPDVEPARERADDITANEDIEYTSNERRLLAGRDVLSVCPPGSQSFH